MKNLFILSALGLAACSAHRSEPLHGALNVSNPKVAKGQAVYMAKCNKCHPGGDAGLGPAINNKPWPTSLLRYQVRHGLGSMPAFDQEEIPVQDLEDLAAYVKALRANG